MESIDVRGTSVSYRALEALAASCPALKAVAADPRGESIGAMQRRVGRNRYKKGEGEGM